jgi:5-methylcytosine-specific restriction protein A
MDPLKPGSRSREYDCYSAILRGQVAYRFLTEKGLGHRELDKSVLLIDPVFSKGFQSMGILRYQGLHKEHVGALNGLTLDGVLNRIVFLDQSKRLLDDLYTYKFSNQTVDENLYQEEFSRKIESAYLDEHAKRLERLSNKKKAAPRKFTALNTVFERDPDVVAETLFQSKGICGKCKNHAPFLRKKDGRPYLEVHHLIPLSQGGEDELSNVIALCPNCHREFHFG